MNILNMLLQNIYEINILLEIVLLVVDFFQIIVRELKDHCVNQVSFQQVQLVHEVHNLNIIIIIFISFFILNTDDLIQVSIYLIYWNNYQDQQQKNKE